MTNAEYVFISYYWYSNFWWQNSITRGTGYTYEPEFCDSSELMNAIDRSFAVDYFPAATPEEEDKPTDVGYVS